MILANLMVGFAVMLVCLIVQAAVAFWSVRYYVRHSSNAAAPNKFFAGIRPLLISMLAMIAGNFIQIAYGGSCSCCWANWMNCTRRSTIRPSISPHSGMATS